MTPAFAEQAAPSSDPSSSARTQENLSRNHEFLGRSLEVNYLILSRQLKDPERHALMDEQHRWEQALDQECTPQDRPASDSHALIDAQLCRNAMTQMRIQWLKQHGFPVLKAQISVGESR